VLAYYFLGSTFPKVFTNGFVLLAGRGHDGYSKYVTCSSAVTAITQIVPFMNISYKTEMNIVLVIAHTLLFFWMALAVFQPPALTFVSSSSQITLNPSTR